jgi:hypothetical protein
MNTAILHELAHCRPATDTGQHRLAAGPLNRAIRACLEVTDCAVTLQEIIGDATARAHRDRELRAILAAAARTAGDITAETDALGLALLQLEIVAGGRP